MLSLKPDALYDEIKAAVKLRNAHLEVADDCWTYLTGQRYGTRAKFRVVDNGWYEYMTVVGSMLAFDHPRFNVQALGGARRDVWERHTFEDLADGLRLALNQLAVNNNWGGLISDAARDFLVGWASLAVFRQDAPGYRGAELTPMQPKLVHVEPRHTILDAHARHWEPERHNGPRLMGHEELLDFDDMIADPEYDSDAVRQLAQDNDLEAFYGSAVSGLSHSELPKRKQCLVYHLWLPEPRLDGALDRQMSDPKYTDYNGVMLSIGSAVQSSDAGGGQSSKQAVLVRRPRPAYTSMSGPYRVQGALHVTGSPYPCGPLVASHEALLEQNRIARQISHDARQWKRFTWSTDGNGDIYKNVEHGDHLNLKASGSEHFKFGQAETGGPSETMYRFSEHNQRLVDRRIGLSQSGRSSPDGDVTATAESIAQAMTNVRFEGLKSALRRGLAVVGKTAGWDAWHSDEFRMMLGAEAMNRVDANGQPAPLAAFHGGLEGREHLSFYDMVFDIDPLSLSYQDQGVRSRSLQNAARTMAELLQVLPMYPGVDAEQVLKDLFDSENLDVSRWFRGGSLQPAAAAPGGPAASDDPGKTGAPLGGLTNATGPARSEAAHAAAALPRLA